VTFEPGDDVMAPWDDGFLYAAVVIRRDLDDPSQILVAYWEGDAATVEAEALQPCVFEVGMRVFANHLNQNNYQEGTILKKVGGAVQVELKNGSIVWTTWAKCRIAVPSDAGN
jgi:hypothetical protein